MHPCTFWTEPGHRDCAAKPTKPDKTDLSIYLHYYQQTCCLPLWLPVLRDQWETLCSYRTWLQFYCQLTKAHLCLVHSVMHACTYCDACWCMLVHIVMHACTYCDACLHILWCMLVYIVNHACTVNVLTDHFLLACPANPEDSSCIDVANLGQGRLLYRPMWLLNILEPAQVPAWVVLKQKNHDIIILEDCITISKSFLPCM